MCDVISLQAESEIIFLGTERMPVPYEVRSCSNAPAIFSHYTSQASNCSSTAVADIDGKLVLKCDKM